MLLIHAQEFPDYSYIEEPLILRISRDDTFVAESDVPYIGGEKKSDRGWFIEIPVTTGDATIPNSSSIKSLFVPDIYLAETVTSDAPFTNYIAELFDENGKTKKFFVKEFRLPATDNNEITWKEIRIFQEDFTPAPEPSGLSTEQMFATFFRRSDLADIVLDFVKDLLIAGENITITENNVGRLIISSTGGGGGETLPPGNYLAFNGNYLTFNGNYLTFTP